MKIEQVVFAYLTIINTYTKTEYAKIEDYIYSIALYQYSEHWYLKDPFVCTGALLSIKWVITAAQCLPVAYIICKQQEKEELWLPSSYYWSPVIETFPHPQYTSLTHDIALLKLLRGVMYKEFTLPFVRLPRIGYRYKNVSLTSTGYCRNYGETNFQKTLVRPWDEWNCNKTAKDIPIENYDDKMCVSEEQPSSNWQQSLTWLDWAGPFVAGKKILVGIATYPFKWVNEDNTTTYVCMITAVEEYLDWINKTIESNKGSSEEEKYV